MTRPRGSSLSGSWTLPSPARGAASWTTRPGRTKYLVELFGKMSSEEFGRRVELVAEPTLRENVTTW
eukprot:8256806-Pyramimonas_sp.AAC.1